MWTEDDRRELAEHCREHDRLMAEEHVPALRDELITKENAADLIFKKIQRPAPQPEESQDWSGWERWLRAHLDNNNAELVEVFTNAVAEALAEIQHATREARAADKAELAALRAADKAELAALRTQVETITATKADIASLENENAVLRAKVDVLTAADTTTLIEKLESDRRERALECADFAIKIAELHSQMKVLGGYLSVNFDPPREFWKRFNDAG
jgi:hypothetical protein